MNILKQFIRSSIRELPEEPFARWASVFLTLSVFTALFSIAASQLFLALCGLTLVAGWIRGRGGALKLETRKSKLENRSSGSENRKLNSGERKLESKSGFRVSIFDFRLLRPVAWPVFFFCLWTLLSMLWATNPAAGGFQIRKLVLFLIILFSFSLILTLQHLERLLGAMFIGSAVAGVLAAFQFVAQYHAVRAAHPGRIYSFMTYTRITGFQGDWMNFGGQQMMVWVMLVAFLLLRGRREPDSEKRKAEFENRKLDAGSQFSSRVWVWWLVCSVIALSILLNFTRSVWLGSFVAFIYLVGRWRARWLWAAPVLAIGLFLFSPHLVRKRLDSVFHPSRDASLAERFEMWHAGWRMIKRHPWLGVGPNNIYEVYDLYLPPGKPPRRGWHYHLHNDYIQFAAERGLPCLAAWLWLMGVLGWQALKVRQSSAHGRWIAEGAFAAWLAFMIEGFFEFNFGTSPTLMVLLFVATTPFIIERIEKSSASAP